MKVEGNTVIQFHRPGEQIPQVVKKSSSPTEPGSRSNASHNRRKKHKTILQRFIHFCKVWRRLIFLVAAVALILFVVIHSIAAGRAQAPEDPDTATAAGEIAAVEAAGSTFVDSEGYPVDMESMTDAWAAEAGFTKRYDLTDAERLEIAQVITAEAEGEPLAGKIAVAQCILQACEDDGLRPAEALEKYSYSTQRPDPTDEALEAVQDVFDFGIVATSEPIKYFYAPDVTASSWHESQTYVMTINNHKFFKEAAEQ